MVLIIILNTSLSVLIQTGAAVNLPSTESAFIENYITIISNESCFEGLMNFRNSILSKIIISIMLMKLKSEILK